MSLHVEGQGARIELVNVEKRFGSVVAVSNTNLEVRSGEFLTLLGPSGCGKTTTLRMIGGFEYPSGGSILIDGVDVVGSDVVEVAPPFDVAGLTALTGATIAFELLCVMAKSVSARKEKSSAAP